MNRQKFLAELSRLLGFMSSWDREAEMNKYIAMLDAAEDEAELIKSLGTPTQLAISIALGYKPTPRPGTEPPPAPEPEPESGDAPAEKAPEADADSEAAAEETAQGEPAEPPEPPQPKKRDETQVVTDGEFEYGMELAILMGEPISAAVESALDGKYLPDPEFSLEEILRESGIEPDKDKKSDETAEVNASAPDEGEPQSAEAPAGTEAAPPVADALPAVPDEGVNTPAAPAAEDAAGPGAEDAPLEAGREATAERAEAAEAPAPDENAQPAAPNAAAEPPDMPEPVEKAEETSGDAGKTEEAPSEPDEAEEKSAAPDGGDAAPDVSEAPKAESGAEPAAEEDKPEDAKPGKAAEGETTAESSGAETAEAEPAEETEEKPDGESGPVFDAVTAPLPESVKNAGEEAERAAPSGAGAQEDPDATQLIPDPANFADLPPDAPIEDEEETAKPRRAVSPGGIIVYVLFALVIGAPVTLVLILIGIPVLLLGLGVIAVTAYAAWNIITALSMISDILLVAGTGLAICGLGLLIAWFGLWLSIELGSLWINAVLLRLGSALCFKKEAA